MKNLKQKILDIIASEPKSNRVKVVLLAEGKNFLEARKKADIMESAPELLEALKFVTSGVINFETFQEAREKALKLINRLEE